VESFKYLGSILTNDGRCTCEIKCRIAMAMAAFNKKRTLFTSTLDLELRIEASEVLRLDHSFMIYLLTTVGLSPGGSTHLHTNST
jgi:hypothetical protein